MTRLICGAILFCLATAALKADEVRLLAESDTVYVGVPFTAAIDVITEGDHTPPEFPKLDNIDVESAGQNTSSSTSIQIINGRQTSRVTQTTRYLYRITPREQGGLVIPPVTVQVNGSTLRSNQLTLRVDKAETGDLLYLDLEAAKDSVYVGEPVELRLEVWLRPFSQGRDVLSANDMWRTIDQNSTDWGPFKDLVETPRPKVTYRQDRRQGDDGVMHEYFVYELSKQIWPERAGPVDVGDLRVVVNYPLRIGRNQSMFSIFDDRRVTSSKPIAARIENTPVLVKPIPKQNRPPYFSGAVGPHEIEVSAEPLNVSVGDPITLNIKVTGQGRLDLLQAPPLKVLPEFTSRFRINEDQLPGVVDNDTKRFTQSIRALSADVDEIPAIPFAYFDTDTRKFVTVQSDPIPIEVSGAQKMSVSQIVEAGDQPSASGRTLTHLQRGIESNYTNPDELLATQAFHPGAGTAALLAASPLLYICCLLVRRRRERLTSDIALARRRTARRDAMNRLAQAETDTEPRQAAGTIASAALGYIADRLNLPPGGLTRGEAVNQLRTCDASAEVVAEVDVILTECEMAQFAGFANNSAPDMVSRTRVVIDRLEKERL